MQSTMLIIIGRMIQKTILGTTKLIKVTSSKQLSIREKSIKCLIYNSICHNKSNLTQIVILNHTTYTISRIISIKEIICILKERVQMVIKIMMKRWMNNNTVHKIKNRQREKIPQMIQVPSIIDNRVPSLPLRRLIFPEVE